MNYLQFINESLNSINYKVIKFPSTLAIKYLQQDKKQSKYINKLIKDFNGEIIIDVDKQKLIGNIFVNKNKDKGFITNLIVRKEYRRQGFGSLLLKDAIDKYDAYDLTVDKDNISAVNLYKKFGFKIMKNGTTEKRYYMKKR